MGNTKCSKWPKEVCSVSKKNVKKYTPITGCTKEPRELCAPAGCGFTQGEETCYEKQQTIVQDAPKESCSLEPEDLQARDQAGAQALSHRGVCRCPQGGLHKVQNQPQARQETCCQEVVLRAF